MGPNEAEEVITLQNIISRYSAMEVLLRTIFTYLIICKCGTFKSKLVVIFLIA